MSTAKRRRLVPAGHSFVTRKRDGTILTAPTGTAFRCVACDDVIPHPPSQEDCPTVNGICGHLLKAGAELVWVRVHAERLGKERLILARGGLVCAHCARTLGVRRRRRAHLEVVS